MQMLDNYRIGAPGWRTCLDGHGASDRCYQGQRYLRYHFEGIPLAFDIGDVRGSIVARSYSDRFARIFSWKVRTASEPGQLAPKPVSAVETLKVRFLPRSYTIGRVRNAREPTRYPYEFTWLRTRNETSF